MNPKQEITDLTICRALFAAWVFIYHVDLHANFSAYLGPAAGLIRHGYLGVDGFFTLSGMILGRVHPELAYAPEGALRFWGKRLARIYPVHLAVIIILAVLFLTGLGLGLTPRDPQRFTAASLVENLLLVQGWGFAIHLAWNYPSWSVSTEWAGYLSFPFLWYFLGRWRPIIPGQILIIVMAVLGTIAFETGVGLNLTYAGALLRFFPEFIIGMTTVRLVPINADYMPCKWLTIIGFALAAAGALVGLDFMSALGLWLVLAALMMQADAERPPIFGNARIPRFLGRLSYAFYMSFGTIELILAQLFRQEGWDPAAEKLLYTAAMTVLTFALAVILHVLVETPCRRLGDRLLAVREPLAVNSIRL
jgi:peptidoglycan/LPS O-acetylase OafA/YrhL